MAIEKDSISYIQYNEDSSMCWKTIFSLCLLQRQRKIYSFARLAVFPKHIFEMYIVFAFVYFCNSDFLGVKRSFV